MSETPARDRIVAQLVDARDEWRAVTAEVGPDRVTEPGPMGDWSYHDLATHLLFWRGWTIARLEAAADGGAAPAQPWPDGLEDDDVNAWIQAQGADRPTADVLDAMDASFGRLAAVLARFPESVLTDPDAMPQLEGVAPVDQDWASHFHVEHEASVRDWLARRG